jgi:spore coat polysaccharide biosynthesis protein SpsF (cytidylyltransferase family)
VSIHGLIVFIQARMGSVRFPGKSLTQLAGKPVLQRVVERLAQRFPLSSVRILTSTKQEDDAIELLGERLGLSSVRGHPTNVADRFRRAIEQIPCTYFARVSGDSPLIDPEIVEDVARNTIDGHFLFGTTAAGRARYPAGMNVEVLKTRFFSDHYPRFSTPDHFEHVTRFFYQPEFEPVTHYAECPLHVPESYRFTIDVPDDLRRIEKLIAGLSQSASPQDLAECCRMYGLLLEDR